MTRCLWRNLNGTGGIWERITIAESLTDVRAIDATDMDQDGDPDFAVGSSDGSFWLENTGSGWATHQVSTQNVDCIQAGDIDGDGDSDFTAWREYSYSGRWYENLDGVGGAWQEHTVWQGEYAALCGRLEDLDADGDVDVLISQEDLPNVVYFENLDGQGSSWAVHVVCSAIGSVYLQWFGLEASDLDLDGDFDVIVAGSDPMPEGMVAWIENLDGTGGSWQKHSIENSLVGANSISIEDLDGDGDRDVMATSGSKFGWDENLVVWYENIDGEETVWNGHELDTTTADACDVASVDMDGDGDPDVVASDNFIGMRWYEFSRATSGWLESSILDPPGGSQLQWTDLSWEATVPPGTILTFQVRASNDPADMGDWSPAFAVPGGITQYLPEPAWYFQYRVNMMTGVPPGSPVLDELLVQYDPVGIEGGPDPTEPCLTVLSGNPSSGVVTLDVYLPEAGQTSLGIYDLSGRLVSEPLEGNQEAGHHEVVIDDLPTGCYWITSTTSGSSLGVNLVVLH